MITESQEFFRELRLNGESMADLFRATRASLLDELRDPNFLTPPHPTPSSPTSRNPSTPLPAKLAQATAPLEARIADLDQQLATLRVEAEASADRADRLAKDTDRLRAALDTAERQAQGSSSASTQLNLKIVTLTTELETAAAAAAAATTAKEAAAASLKQAKQRALLMQTVAGALLDALANECAEKYAQMARDAKGMLAEDPIAPEQLRSISQTLSKIVQHTASRGGAEVERWKDLYNQEHKARRAVHDELIELKGAIRVFCRMRPPSPSERATGGPGRAVNVLSDMTIMADMGKPGQKPLRFDFDYVFGPKSTQADVFQEVEALVTSVLDGFNVCILAYGQTGYVILFLPHNYIIYICIYEVYIHIHTWVCGYGSRLSY